MCFGSLEQSSPACTSQATHHKYHSNYSLPLNWHWEKESPFSKGFTSKCRNKLATQGEKKKWDNTKSCFVRALAKVLERDLNWCRIVDCWWVGGGNYNCSRMGLICYDNFTMLVAFLLRVFRLSLSFVSLTVAAAPFVSYTHDAMERIWRTRSGSGNSPQLLCVPLRRDINNISN